MSLNSVTKLALDFPASPMIATVGADIVASADPTCTDAEKASLVTAEAGLEEAAAAVEDAYNEAQVSYRCVKGISRYFLNILWPSFYCPSPLLGTVQVFIFMTFQPMDDAMLLQSFLLKTF